MPKLESNFLGLRRWTETLSPRHNNAISHIYKYGYLTSRVKCTNFACSANSTHSIDWSRAPDCVCGHNGWNSPAAWLASSKHRRELFIGTWKYLLGSFYKRQLGQLKGNCIFILLCVTIWLGHITLRLVRVEQVKYYLFGRGFPVQICRTFITASKPQL